MGSPYSDRYAAIYRRLYIEHPQWADKHRFNLEMIRSLLPPGGAWLDLFCGQAWHFSRIDLAGTRVGVDASAAQLAIAAAQAPGAELIEADLRRWDTERRFDLVTCFWSGISYLDDLEAIDDLLARIVGWTRPGGHVYLELVTPESLESFNAIDFAVREGCEVGDRSGDWIRWSYRDPGGEHLLTSPGFEFFRDRLAGHFRSITSVGTGEPVITALRQVVARQRIVRR